jgi:ribosomal protein L7/L12
MNWIIIFFAGVIVISVIVGRKQKAARKHFENLCAGGDGEAAISSRVRQLAGDGRKVEAIRQLRSDTGLGLKDAKEILERL